MSRYTVSKQGRTHGAYRRRLELRGLRHSPTMPFFDANGKHTSKKPATGKTED